MTLADLGPNDTPDTPIEMRPGKISWARLVRYGACERFERQLTLPPGATHAQTGGGPVHAHYSYYVFGEGEPPANCEEIS
jgi:hypothetical protein